jgi:hypothetical protein
MPYSPSATRDRVFVTSSDLGIVGRQRPPKVTLDDLFVNSLPDAVFTGEKTFPLGQILPLLLPFFRPLERFRILSHAQSLEPVADAHPSLPSPCRNSTVEYKQTSWLEAQQFAAVLCLDNALFFSENPLGYMTP